MRPICKARTRAPGHSQRFTWDWRLAIGRDESLRVVRSSSSRGKLLAAFGASRSLAMGGRVRTLVLGGCGSSKSLHESSPRRDAFEFSSRKVGPTSNTIPQRFVPSTPSAHRPSLRARQVQKSKRCHLTGRGPVGERGRFMPTRHPSQTPLRKLVGTRRLQPKSCERE